MANVLKTLPPNALNTKKRASPAHPHAHGLAKRRYPSPVSPMLSLQGNDFDACQAARFHPSSKQSHEAPKLKLDKQYTEAYVAEYGSDLTAYMMDFEVCRSRVSSD